jgi:hypothetical protein
MDRVDLHISQMADDGGDGPGASSGRNPAYKALRIEPDLPGAAAGDGPCVRLARPCPVYGLHAEYVSRSVQIGMKTDSAEDFRQ